MELKEEQVKVYVLTLTEEEASWLRDVMRHPLYGEESHYSKRLREAFFNILTGYI